MYTAIPPTGYKTMPPNNPDFGILFIVVIFMVAVFATLFPEEKDE